MDGLHRVKLNDIISLNECVFCMGIFSHKEDLTVVFAVIGTGNMGQALVSGFLRKGVLKPEEIRLYDIETAKVNAFAKKTGCKAFPSAAEAVDKADYVLLAVKPQVFEATFESMRNKLPSTAVVISIAASVTVSRIMRLVKKDTPIVRVMPNTPALVGSGVSAVCFCDTNEQEQEFVLSLFKTCGLVVPCDESTLDAIGCVSGTGPAFVMLFIESLADAAVKLGIPRKVAYEISAMTVLGSGKLVIETGQNPAYLKDQVCSPGGTTIEGVLALEKNGLRYAVESAVLAADAKTKLLAGGGQ